MSNKYLIKYNQFGGEYLDYYFYRLFSIFGDKNYKYKFATEMINMIDGIVDFGDNQYMINKNNVDKIRDYVSKISDNYKLKKEENLALLDKTINIFIEYINRLNRLENKHPSNIRNFYNLKLKELQEKLLIKDDEYIVKEFIEKDYFENNPINTMYNLKKTDEEDKKSTYLNYINNLLKGDQDELILNYNEEMLDRKIQNELYPLIKKDGKEYIDLNAKWKYLGIVSMFNSFIKYEDIKEYEKLLKEEVNIDKVINALNDSFNNDDNDGIKIKFKKDKVKEIKGIKIEILDNNEFKIISGKQSNYDNNIYNFINLSESELSSIIQNIKDSHEEFLRDLKLFYLDQDKILYRRIYPMDIDDFIKDLKGALNEYQKIDVEKKNLSQIPNNHDYKYMNKRVINDYLEQRDEYYSVKNKYNDLTEKNKKKRINNIINNIVKNYEQKYDGINKITYQQKLNEFKNKYKNILKDKFKERKITLNFLSNKYNYNGNDLKIGEKIKIYEPHNFNILKGILNGLYDNLIKKYISEDTADHYKIKVAHLIYFNSYIYQQEFKKFYTEYTLYNDFQTSYINNREKKYEIINKDKENDIGAIFEYRVGLPTFAYIINKLSSNDETLDVSGFRFYNGVKYSVKGKNKNGEDAYHHIGELDILILNKENEIIAIGEIKSYFDGIIKAYQQMNRFIKYLRTSPFSKLKFTYEDLNNEITDLDFISGHKINTNTSIERNKNIFIILKEDKIVNYIGTVENQTKFITELIKKNIIKINESGKLVTDEQILSEKLDKIVVHNLKRIKDPNLKKSVLDKIYYDKNTRRLLLDTKEILEKYNSVSNLSNILVFKERLVDSNINLTDFSKEIKGRSKKDKKKEEDERIKRENYEKERLKRRQREKQEREEMKKKKEKEEKVRSEREKERKEEIKDLTKYIESPKIDEQKDRKIDDIRIQQLNKYRDQQKKNKEIIGKNYLNK